jgi:hypothetical protein
MSQTAEREKMGRPKGKRTERDDVAVKVDRKIVGKAKMISAHEGIPVAQILSEILRDPIDKRYAKMLRELEGGPE